MIRWKNAITLDRPLPTGREEEAGPLNGLALRSVGGHGELELSLERAARAQLRRIDDSWVLRLDPEPDAVASLNEVLLLDVSVNGRPLADVVRAERADGALLIPFDAWNEARLAPQAQRRTLSDGTPAYAIDAVPGAAYEIDRKTQALRITAPGNAFVASLLDQQDAAPAPPERPQPGLVFNYDAAVANNGRGTPVASAATFEAIAFGQFGSVVSSALVRDDAQGRGARRLDTFWRYDMPHRLETLVIGDAVGSGGAWSRPVRFGGVRWGRDFSMRPGFVTLPQLSLTGEAALPSTIDVLVNNAKRSSQPLPPGPFELTSVPVITGAGEINLVVRDLLGHETLLRQSYYASPRLLAPGLTDFSFEAGRLRSGYGQDSHYGARFGAATWRAGITSSFTGEARVEVQDARRAAGLEVAGLLGSWAVGRAAMAASAGSAQDPDVRGRLVQLGIERSTQRGGSLQYEHASRGFSPFGESPLWSAAAQRPRERIMASVGGPVAGRLSGGASYIRQSRWDGERIRLAALSLSVPLWQNAIVSASLNKRLDGDRSWRAGVNLNMPLDDGIQLAGRVDNASDGPAATTLGAALPAPPGPGLGWRAEASTLRDQRARAGVQYNTNQAELSADVASNARGQAALRAGARGSLGWLAGLAFASRPIGQGSFAVVEVEGFGGIPVMRSHQVVATTDARGLAFVPGLLPWQKNQLEIDPVELPLDAAIGEASHAVTPYPGSGAVVKFAVRRSRQALAVLRQSGGELVPVGARVRVMPGGAEFIAGKRGEVWLTDLQSARQSVVVSWEGGGCALEFALPESNNMPSRLGPFTCGSN